MPCTDSNCKTCSDVNTCDECKDDFEQGQAERERLLAGAEDEGDALCCRETRHPADLPNRGERECMRRADQGEESAEGGGGEAEPSQEGVAKGGVDDDEEARL